MGFWDAVGKGLAAIANNPQSWYIMGKTAGANGESRRTFEFKGQGVDPELIQAYDRGYDDGRSERRR